MKNLFLYIFSLLCLLSCIKEEQTGNILDIGDYMPEFSVLLNDGSVLTSADLSKGVSLVVFFYTGCPDCQRTLPVINKIYKEYCTKGVQFAIISREEKDDSISEYWQSQGYSMPYSAQETRAIYELFATSRVPRVYVFKNGVIRKIYTDAPTPTYSDIMSDLDALL